MMMSPNCSGVVSRPSVSIGSSRMREGGRRLPDLAGGCVQVLAQNGVGHVVGRHAERRRLCGSSQGADAVVACPR